MYEGVFLFQKLTVTGRIDYEALSGYLHHKHDKHCSTGVGRHARLSEQSGTSTGY